MSNTIARALTLGAATVALAGAAYAGTAIGHAETTGSYEYFQQLYARGMQIWDYPGMLRTGYAVCDLLWYDVNPHAWLVYSVGYSSQDASAVISSAQAGLCPGNYVAQ